MSAIDLNAGTVTISIVAGNCFTVPTASSFSNPFASTLGGLIDLAEGTIVQEAGFTFHVQFAVPFKKVPTVVASLGSSNNLPLIFPVPGLGDTAIITSGEAVSNVSTTGFDYSVDSVILGANQSAINYIFNLQATTTFINFIATVE